MGALKEVRVVAIVAMFNGKVLIARRAYYMPTNANLWSVPAGRIEEGESVEQAALRELMEETKLSGKITRVGKEYPVEVEGYRCFVNPVLVEVESQRVVLNGEHAECRWVEPREIFDYRRVPLLERDFEEVGISLGKPPETRKLSDF